MCIALCTQNASILIVIADLLWLEQRYVDIFFASRALHCFTILAFLVVRSLYQTVLHKCRLRLIVSPYQNTNGLRILEASEPLALIWPRRDARSVNNYYCYNNNSRPLGRPFFNIIIIIIIINL